MNTIGDHIRCRYLDLGLFQKQVAEQIGVHEQSITNCEGNASSPPIRYMPEIIGFLGNDPFASETSIPERLIATRRARGWSQRQMAERLGIDQGTLQGWESGEHKPSQKKLELIAKVLPER